MGSKFDSLLTKVEEVQPAVLCLTDTHLLGTDGCKIDGYEKIFRNDRDNKGGGGLLIAISDDIKNISTIVEKKSENGECLWVVIDNNKVKIRLGLIYAPQESRTTKEKLKLMYDDIKDQVMQADEKQQKTLLLGDFNCKIGEEIQGNRTDVTKGGKLLLKMAERNRLSILNKSDICQGLWTRVDDKCKSVLDYIMVDKDSEDGLKKMVIDENQEFAPTAHEGPNSDHNVMLAEFDWIVLEQLKEKGRTVKVNNEKSYAQAGEEMEKENISGILEQELDIHLCYDQWKQTVEKIEYRNK